RKRKTPSPTTPSATPPAAPTNGRARPKRVSPPRARCVVNLGDDVKTNGKSEVATKPKSSASAHRRRKRLAIGVERVRRINVVRKFVTRRVNDKGPAALFGNLLIERVLAHIFAGGRRHQKFFGKLLR